MIRILLPRCKNNLWRNTNTTPKKLKIKMKITYQNKYLVSMLEQLNYDITNYLSDHFLVFNSLINLSCTCKHFYNDIYIINLYNIGYKYLTKLTDIILTQRRYTNVLYLNADMN